jgi:imidazolonepropionase-like amidohydrolase
LLIQNGKVIAAGTSVNIPKKHNYSQFRRKSIYPSFIDMYTSFGMDNPRKQKVHDKVNRMTQNEKAITGMNTSVQK